MPTEDQMTEWLKALIWPHIGRVDLALMDDDRIEAQGASVNIPVRIVARQLLALQATEAT